MAIPLTRLTILVTALTLGGCSDVDRAYYTVSNTVHSAFYDLRHTNSARPAHSTSQAPAPPGNYNDASV
ncbi:MAG TPA: hypothetical protein VKQ27_06280, partial [Acetobacteraceae bacterium]|nr:hypothetical protein [Acetobacteraceae bacterium]